MSITGALGSSAGAGFGGTLGRLIEPLDNPRQALWNIPSKIAQGDWLGALPGLLGVGAGAALGATGFGLPLAMLGGSLLGGTAQGIGKSTDEERFAAPTADDVTGGAGGPVGSFLLHALGDPLTYAGMGAGGAVGRAAEKEGVGSLASRFLREESGALKPDAISAHVLGRPELHAHPFYSTADVAAHEIGTSKFAGQPSPLADLLYGDAGMKVGPHIPAEEMQYRNIQQFLNEHPFGTPEELQAYLRQNPAPEVYAQFSPAARNRSIDTTRVGDLPRQDIRMSNENLLHPDGEPYQHGGGVERLVENRLARSAGGDVLDVRSIRSPMHDAGAAQGYMSPQERMLIARRDEALFGGADLTDAEHQALMAMRDVIPVHGPFQETASHLGMKQVINDAAKGNTASVSYQPGMLSKPEMMPAFEEWLQQHLRSMGSGLEGRAGARSFPITDTLRHHIAMYGQPIMGKQLPDESLNLIRELYGLGGR